ncbi:uncharacterized protein LOC120528177 isoform X2 [Polypterus senegalus]|uniref:uncharacterized protein LOC120528177 isoform X2 n=1 Tax=Polypterus senegalus TaxID=55291 RepID=UPI001966B417|nr:uncharacterized protein LOC120528177 isoform X2 [Polypterus senegalus]
MVREKWMGEHKKEQCLKRQREATEHGISLSIEVTLNEKSSKRFISVYEPKVSYYSRLARVFAYYDIKCNSWHCPCSKPRMSCLHKYIAKWHLFQTNRELFKRVKSTEDSEEFKIGNTKDTNWSESDSVRKETLYPPKGDGLVKMVTYLYHKKRIPAILPTEVCAPPDFHNFPKHLIPAETSCSLCPGIVPLTDPVLISSKAKIVTFYGTVEGVATYCKQCELCGQVYRFQEWSGGLHNFNDHIILSIHLCLFLRNSLQNHTSIGNAIDILELTTNQKFPKRDCLLHGYLHFEALSAHEYNYSCIRCGFHPPVVVMDLHKKGVFSMPASEIEETPTDYDGKVNVEDFWESVDLEMISRGFVKSNCQNPFVVKPNYHNWAPWIGSHTRKSSAVLNTEFAKIPQVQEPEEASDIFVTEDRLCGELTNLKVAALRKLVKNCGLSPKGSKMDLILRLRNQMQNRATYDKIFQKVWGASGQLCIPFNIC